MAKYMILIYGDAEQWEAMTDEQWKAHGRRTRGVHGRGRHPGS